VAVSAGAKVIALGSYVDLAAPPVAAAVGAAATHDVLVVAGAPTADRRGASGAAAAGPPAASDAPDALVRAGGVDEDRQPAEPYRAGAVDVLAPGVGVTSVGLGKSGVRAVSGTQYAVAFVAGVAALVRAAYPNLTAPQVAHRIKVTSASPGGAPPRDGTGWGMVSAEAAVTKALPEEDRHVGAGTGKGGAAGRVALAVLVAAVLMGLAAVAVLARRTRRARATRAGAGYPATGEAPDPPDPPDLADPVGDPLDLVDHLPGLIDHVGDPRGAEDG
jgi:hypothetical protein